MSDFLKSMAAASRARAELAEKRPASADLDRPLVPLTLGSFDIIAEIKGHSPSEGELASPDSDRATRAVDYAAGGAAAISVLTEPTRFAGALEHLDEVARSVPTTPVMRKDFLVDTVQVLEARRAGASGVLLIIAMLDEAGLQDLLACAAEHGMFVLLEAFDEVDLERATKLLLQTAHRDRAAAGELLVGINTRNLRTLEVDPARLEQLAPLLPAARSVAESGLKTSADAARVAELGYRLALVGTALMRSRDPRALVAEMRSAGMARIAA